MAAETNTTVENETNSIAVTEASIKVYDDTYTVSQLREAAKERGITGYSSMTKAQLLEALNNND